MPAAKRQSTVRTTKGNTYGEVAEYRIRDYQTLLKAGRWDAAVYLAGYVIECRLKYAICQSRSLTALPSQYASGNAGHDLDGLLQASGITSQPESSKTGAAWSVLVDEWKPLLRYIVKRQDRVKAEKFCKLVDDVYDWLKEECP